MWCLGEALCLGGTVRSMIVEIMKWRADIL